MLSFVSSQNPDKNEYNIKKIAKSLSNLSWIELPETYRYAFPQVHLKKYQYPDSGIEARYHIDQTLCLIRMPPDSSEQAISIKEKSLNSIFEANVPGYQFQKNYIDIT